MRPTRSEPPAYDWLAGEVTVRVETWRETAAPWVRCFHLIRPLVYKKTSPRWEYAQARCLDCLQRIIGVLGRCRVCDAPWSAWRDRRRLVVQECWWYAQRRQEWRRSKRGVGFHIDVCSGRCNRRVERAWRAKERGRRAWEREQQVWKQARKLYRQVKAILRDRQEGRA